MSKHVQFVLEHDAESGACACPRCRGAGGPAVLRVTLTRTPDPATYRAMLRLGWRLASGGPN